MELGLRVSVRPSKANDLDCRCVAATESVTLCVQMKSQRRFWNYTQLFIASLNTDNLSPKCHWTWLRRHWHRLLSLVAHGVPMRFSLLSYRGVSPLGTCINMTRGSIEWMNLLNTSNGTSKNADSALFWRMSWSAAGRVKRSSVRTERNKSKLSPNHVDGSSLSSTPILG